jgi:hypothetical protein
MTTLLAEQPLLLSFLLAVLAAACIYGWMQSGKRAVAIAGLFFLALIPVGWLVAEYWVTDRERIRELIYNTADAVETNDIDRAVKVIGPQHADLVARARTELANYEFTQANVNQIQSINMIPGSFPKQADVELTVTVVVSSKRGQFASMKVPRRLSLRFEQQSEEAWVVVAYDHRPIIGDRDSFSPTGP